MSNHKPFDVKEEREDVYRKLKCGYDVLASIMCDGKENLIHRIRAATALPETAKTLRLFLLDVEKYDELEKKIDGLIKQNGKRDRVIKSINNN